jgi:phytoene dehydrogenase-like protein
LLFGAPSREETVDPMTEAYDAIVIGAGHNGLVCAAYLARSGMRTVVLERSEVIGGACVTGSPWPGFRISTGAHTVANFGPQIVRDLGLDLPLVPRDPRSFSPAPDGGGILWWDDAARTKEQIARFSAPDADGYFRLLELFDTAAAHLRPLLGYPATKRQVMRALRLSGIEKLYRKVIGRSVADACREYLESDIVQGAVAANGVLGASAGPETAGTSYMLLQSRLGTGGSAAVRGGLGVLTEQLAGAVRSAGGEIRTGAEVASVRLSTRRAAGVALADGEELEAGVVCSSADPKRTVSLVPREAWLEEFVEDVSLLPTAGTVAKVNCALGELPRFSGVDGDDGDAVHRSSITVAPSIEYLEESCRAAAAGRLPDEMLCKVVFESVADPTMAPDGKHTMSVVAQYLPSDADDAEAVGDAVLATLERYAPGLSGVVEHREVLLPRDLEERFGMTGGHIYHGEMLPDWLFDNRPANGWNRHRTPLPGLYICGAGVHPGGGISGMPGRNGARAVIADQVAAGERTPGSAPGRAAV